MSGRLYPQICPVRGLTPQLTSNIFSRAIPDTLLAKLLVGQAIGSPSYILGDAQGAVCTAPGYAAQSLAAPVLWGANGLEGLFALFPPVVFALTGQGSPAQTIYSVALADDTNKSLLFVAVLTTPWAIPIGGGSLLVQPFFFHRGGGLGITATWSPLNWLSARTLAY